MRKKRLLGFCVMLFLTLNALAQSLTVKGKITDEKGAAIAGATILEKGTTNGTSADADGSFTLKVKQGAVLQVSAIGFEARDIRTAAGKILTITLNSDAKTLSEVVVTGVGAATSKKKLPIAVESISSEKLPAAPTADLGNALVGKIAGAQISSTNGSPGSPVNILLRGINSIRGGTGPMILLDGVQIITGLESIDLNSIDKIEVVQGAAAASIYGAQGANGVIQLISKKGKAGRINIDVSSSWATNSLLNIGNVNKAQKHAFAVNANGEVISSGGTPLEFDMETGSYLRNPIFNLIDPNSKTNQPYNKNLLWYDHYKMFFQNSNTYNNSININGSKDKFDFSFILSDNRQNTVFKNNGDFSRTNLTANIGVELAKGLKLRSTTQIVNTIDKQLDPTGRNMFYAINNSRPFANYEQRDAAGFHSPYFGDAVGVNGYNFNYIIENAKVKDQTIDLVQSLNLNYKLNKFVELDAKYGINRRATNSRFEIAEQSHSAGAAYWEYWAEWYSPRTSYGVPAASSESGEINQGDYVSTFTNFNATANIRFDLKEDFKINIPIKSTTMVGWDYRKSNYKEFISYGTDAPDFTPYNSTNMGNFKIASDYVEDFITYGVLVNQHFDWGDIAGVSAGIRSDYSSAFGRGSKPFTFPRGDAYLRLSSFNFFQNSKLAATIAEWKLRGAYGQAGVQPRAYDRFPVVGTSTIGSQSALSTPVTNANPDLLVQVAEELELGTDVAFNLSKGKWFKGANLSFTYWTRKSKDVIDVVDVAPSLGIGRQLTNSMSLKSNGIQASLNVNVFSSKDLTWNFTANFTKQKSMVDKVNQNAEIVKQSAAGSTQYIIKAGEQIGQIYGYLFLNSVTAKDPSGNFFIAEASQKDFEVASNGYVVNKTTKQPFATAGRYSLGDPNPNFNVAFINEFNYKNFLTFAFQFDWISGSMLYNQTKQWMYRDGIHKDYADPVTINGQTEAWSAFDRGACAVRQANGTKSYFMEDASFVRLRNVAIGFDIAKFVKIKGINRMQLLLTGRNLLTFTKYTGMDPEVSSGTTNSSWDRAVDHNTIPNIKSYQIGLNLGF